MQLSIYVQWQVYIDGLVQDCSLFSQLRYGIIIGKNGKVDKLSNRMSI